MSGTAIRFQMIAKTIEGLEQVLANELEQLGGTDIHLLKRAVSFHGTKKLLYTANYMCRTALRILMPVATFKARDENVLYKRVYGIPWEDYLDINQTFAIDSVISNSVMTHSGYVSLKTKDAVVDRFRNRLGKRPEVDAESPDVAINVHLYKEDCTVSLDSSGGSLHLRGYRVAGVEAPLNEVLAAGLIALSGWDGKATLLDPMCGSGTLLIEGAMKASGIPAGYYRKQFGFERWKDFDRNLWKQVKKECDGTIMKPEVLIVGSDKDHHAIRAARENVRNAGLDKMIRLAEKSFEEFNPPSDQGFIITNPPYGERMKVGDQIIFYRDLGDTLKRRFPGFTAWLLGSDIDALRFIGLRPDRKIRIMNGPLECRFIRIPIYEGSKKDKWQSKDEEAQS